jgi:hypothetical protein
MEFEYTDKGTNTLSIGFAGFYDTNPRFDWNILKRYETDVLLIKDVKMAWYLLGIDGISNNVDETVVFIRKYTYKYKKLMFFGSSMGGYAAILYGSLVNHNDKTINAFSPQVDIRPDIKDDRYSNQWTVRAVREKVHPYINDNDKRYMFLGNINIPEETYIHYGDGHNCDPHQASLINCKRLSYDYDGHSIAVWMHENQMLRPYLTNLYK